MRARSTYLHVLTFVLCMCYIASFVITSFCWILLDKTMRNNWGKWRSRYCVWLYRARFYCSRRPKWINRAKMNAKKRRIDRIIIYAHIKTVNMKTGSLHLFYRHVYHTRRSPAAKWKNKKKTTTTFHSRKWDKKEPRYNSKMKIINISNKAKHQSARVHMQWKLRCAYDPLTQWKYLGNISFAYIVE